jgi:hypothetical protein
VEYLLVASLADEFLSAWKILPIRCQRPAQTVEDLSSIEGCRNPRSALELPFVQ